VFNERGISCITIEEKGWLGIKNGELSLKVNEKDYILLTRDKDFTFLWQEFQIKVIYSAIEPAILEFIKSKVIFLLDNWEYDISRPFLLILQKDTIRFWK